MLDFIICSPGSVLVNFRMGFRVSVPIDTASQVKCVLFQFKSCAFVSKGKVYLCSKRLSGRCFFVSSKNFVTNYL